MILKELINILNETKEKIYYVDSSKKSSVDVSKFIEILSIPNAIGEFTFSNHTDFEEMYNGEFNVVAKKAVDSFCKKNDIDYVRLTLVKADFKK